MTIYISSFLAGLLSILSPCILTVAPILLVSAFQTNKMAPLGMVSGLAFGFTVIGVSIAATGSFVGLDPEWLRYSSSTMFILLGCWLFSQKLQDWMNMKIAPLFSKLQTKSHELQANSVGGYFLLGILMSFVWIPCTGPTLGLAVTFASKGEHFLDATLIMLCYSLGAGLPLIFLSYVSSALVPKSRARFMKAATYGKKVLGFILILTGILVLTRYEEVVASHIARVTPDWLKNITSKY